MAENTQGIRFFFFVIFDTLKCLCAVRKVKTCSDNTEKHKHNPGIYDITCALYT